MISWGSVVLRLYCWLWLLSCKATAYVFSRTSTLTSTCRYIYFNASSHHSFFDEVLGQDEHADLDREADLAKPKFTFTECAIAIVIAIALVTLLAVFLVERIDDVVESGVSDQFLGLILLPLAEKAAEHLTAVDEAWDGQMVRNAPCNLRLYKD